MKITPTKASLLQREYQEALINIESKKLHQKLSRMKIEI